MKESKYKYKVCLAAEIARNNYSFRNQLHHDYALGKNDGLVSEYLTFRESTSFNY
jgi:hypothetical protein